MVTLIQQLQERGYTYAIDGSIYFRIDRFHDYGKLSHLDAKAPQRSELHLMHPFAKFYKNPQSEASGRVDSDEYGKDNMSDFAVWKAWKPEDGNIFWETALGKGRPAWHIECSAMSMQYLGNHFDIHTGGEDNIFPHHENEIAQSEAAMGEPFVNYWLHCRHLLIDNQKMSKSLGNFYTLRDLLEMRAKPKGLRYALLSFHYRQPVNFTLEGLHAAEQSVQRLLDFMQHLRTAHGEGCEVQPLLAQTQQRFEEMLDDDLNISGALGAIFEMVREVNRAIAEHRLSAAEAQQVAALMQRFDTVLGLLTEDEATGDPQVAVLLEERQSARQRGDFTRADRLRAQIQELGYIIEDTPQGPRLKRLGVYK
jgi:cysteinyl-tRNA synthetase